MKDDRAPELSWELAAVTVGAFLALFAVMWAVEVVSAWLR